MVIAVRVAVAAARSGADCCQGVVAVAASVCLVKDPPP